MSSLSSPDASKSGGRKFFKSIFGKLPSRKLKHLGSKTSILDLTLGSSVMSKSTSFQSLSQSPDFSFSNDSFDSERAFDEQSDGELDLHDIVLDTDNDQASTGSRGRLLPLPQLGQNNDVDALLASIPNEALSAPKYAKFYRKNVKSPRMVNSLFLAQELSCSPASLQTDSHSDKEDSDAFSLHASDPRLKTPMYPNEILAMEFSRDGKYLAVAGRDSKITVWQVISSPLSRLKYKTLQAAKEDAGSSRKSKRQVYDSSPVFLQEPVRVFKGHTKSILCLDWSKNNFLLSGSMDKTVKLWNIDRPDCLQTFEHYDFVTALKFHPNDDRFFISGALDNQLRLWLILESSIAYTNDLGDNALITALEFTPYGNYCMVGGFNGSLFCLETQGLHLVKRIDLKGKLKINMSHSSNGLKVTGIRVFENSASSDIPPSDLRKWNMLITVNDSSIRLVDLRSKKLVSRFSGANNRGAAIAASLSEDGQYIVSGSEDHWCYIWDNNNSIINQKLRLAMKEAFLEGKNHVDEKHKKLSRLIHDSRLWKKLPVQMFLEDENGKSYIANVNNSYSSFHANHAKITNALFAPEKTKRLLQFSDDAVYDLVKKGDAILGKGKLNDDGNIPGHIIVTADSNGFVRVFRQDAAFNMRKDLTELKKNLNRRTNGDTESCSPSHLRKDIFGERMKSRSRSPTFEGSSFPRSKLLIK